jgi:hypothetical protein
MLLNCPWMIKPIFQNQLLKMLYELPVRVNDLPYAETREVVRLIIGKGLGIVIRALEQLTLVVIMIRAVAVHVITAMLFLVEALHAEEVAHVQVIGEQNPRARCEEMNRAI